MKFEVYKIQNKITNKIYIGITTQGYQKRFRNHLKEVEAGSAFILHNAIRKYREDSFSITLLEEVNSIEELKEREKFWIKALDTTNREKGYNMTEGGDGTFGRLHSDETKAKISEKAKGRVSKRRINVRIENLLTKIVDNFTNLGEASRFLGKGDTYLSEYRNRLKKESFSIGDNIISFSKEVFEKPAKKVRDVEAQMKKLQQVSKEVRAANPEKYKAIYRNARLHQTKIVQQLDLEDNLIAEYNGSRHAAEMLGSSKKRSPIQGALKGRLNTAYGFKWKYRE